jgi:hypothetical protein
MKVGNLEERIRYLEDLEEIRRLKHYYYCRCVDCCVAGDAGAIEQTISRFADNIVADFTGLPRAEGKAAVIEFYAQTVPAGLTWSQHRVMNEVIDIDGDQASGLWYVDCPVRFRGAGDDGYAGSGFVAGRYEETYCREQGIWKWTSITALLDVTTPFDQNWQDAILLMRNPRD